MNRESSVAKFPGLDSSGIASTADPILRISPSFPESSASASRTSPMIDQPSSSSGWHCRTRNAVRVPDPGEMLGGGGRESMELASSWSDSIMSDSSSKSPGEE